MPPRRYAGCTVDYNAEWGRNKKLRILHGTYRIPRYHQKGLIWHIPCARQSLLFHMLWLSCMILLPYFCIAEMEYGNLIKCLNTYQESVNAPHGYIYIYIYIYVYICIYMYIYMCVCVYIYWRKKMVYLRQHVYISLIKRVDWIPGFIPKSSDVTSCQTCYMCIACVVMIAK